MNKKEKILLWSLTLVALMVMAIAGSYNVDVTTTSDQDNLITEKGLDVDSLTQAGLTEQLNNHDMIERDMLVEKIYSVWNDMTQNEKSYTKKFLTIMQSGSGAQRQAVATCIDNNMP